MQGMDLTSNSYTDKLDISVSGTTPTGGYLNYENSILKDGCLTMDEYKVTIENGEVTKTEKGSCESQSLTACDSPNFKPSPEEWFTFDASTNTITGFSDAWDGTTDIVIPCQIDGVDVINIRGGSFPGKQVTSVIFNDNIKIIGAGSFPGSQLSTVIIGDGVTTIGSGSFNDSKIKKLNLGDSVELIDNGAFSSNLIEELIIPDSVITIESSFSSNKIKKLKLGKNLEKIGAAAFASNNLKTVEIPSSVKIINGSAFATNQLEEVYVYGNDIEIAGASFFKNDISNPNLKIIYNNTGKSLDWGMIISGSNNSTEYVFETGTVINEYGNVEIKKSN